MDPPKPHRIDHIYLTRRGRLTTGATWLFLRIRSREGWLVLMDTGEVRLYDVDKKAQAPILTAPSPRDVESKLRRGKVKIRVGKTWRRIKFSGREKPPGVAWLEVAGKTGEIFVEGLGPLGDVLDWSKEGVERTRNTRRRRAARAAWRSVLSGGDWSAVPGNVEPDQGGDAPTADEASATT